jgi:anti-sigma regulatory factor (Ser/Thr protein kinase)
VTELLDQGRSRPLGVQRSDARPEARYRVPGLATLLLYTDGLIERRRQPLTAGIDKVAAVVRDGRAASLEELASGIMSDMAPETGFDDDVALLLYRHPGPLEIDFPAEAARLSPVRAALRTWLARCGIDTTTAQNVLVAVGEACANAIEHGHRFSADGRIYLRAAATGAHLHLTVTDSGHWRTPDPVANAHRGRGLALMRALMTEVTISTGSAGTVVGLQARIPR